MPQFVETISVVVTQAEIAAIIHEKMAQQFGVAPEQIDIVNFRMNSSITFHRDVGVTEQDFEIQPRNFVVTITKPQAQDANDGQAATSDHQQ